MANQYFTCVLDTWKDGATIYARMHYYRSGAYTYQDTSFPNPTMTIAGETFTDSAFGDRVRSGISVGDVYTTTFSKTVSANGTYGISFNAGSGLRNDFAGTWTGSETIDSVVVKPNKPTISGNNVDAYTNQISFGTSSFGNPNSGTVRLYRGKSDNPTTEITTARKSSTGTSSFTDTGLEPNTTYYYRTRAFNSGGGQSDYSSTITVKTKPASYAPYPNDPTQSNVAKPILSMGAPLNGLKRKVLKIYDSVNGVARRIY